MLPSASLRGCWVPLGGLPVFPGMLHPSVPFEQCRSNSLLGSSSLPPPSWFWGVSWVLEGGGRWGLGWDMAGTEATGVRVAGFFEKFSFCSGCSPPNLNNPLLKVGVGHERR